MPQNDNQNLESIGVFGAGNPNVGPAQGAGPSPMGPVEESGMPPMGGPSGPSEPIPQGEEAMRADLESGLAKVTQANSTAITDQHLFANKMKQMKIEVLKQLYQTLEEMGVNAADQNSVQSFLQKLEQDDPDLLALFQMMFDTLNPDGSDAMDKSAEANGGLQDSDIVSASIGNGPPPTDSFTSGPAGQNFDMNQINEEMPEPAPSPMGPTDGGFDVNQIPEEQGMGEKFSGLRSTINGGQ